MAHSPASQTTPISNPNIDTVSLNYRYSSAWNEVNTRIAQRQSALTIFVTLLTAILTVMATLATSKTPLDPNVFSLLIPVLSLIFGALNYKHDKTIALLRFFLSECENKGLGKDMPSYNSDPRFRTPADATRNFHDYSCAGIIILFNILGILTAIRAYPDTFQFTGWPLLAYILGIIISVGLVTRSIFKPHKF
jgi:hypothetical protein